MEQMGLPQVVAAIDEHCRSGDHERAGAMLWPALDQFPHVGALWFYAAALFMEEGKSVLAMACWEKCYQLECNPEVLVNLGAAARMTNQVELARATLERLLEIRPDDAKALSNLTGGYVNEGNPKPGIEYGERCLELDPEAKQGRFNLGLLYLEDGQYGKGFDCYADGFHRLRHPKVYTPDPPYLTPERFAELKQVAFKPRLIVAGEQGLGDEIMFSTMLDDVLEDFDVILDGHPRLESLYRRSRFASRITIHGTRKVDSPEWSHEAHAKVMIGDLGRFYRRTPESFRWTGPIHSADPVEAGQLRAHLQSLAKGRPIIGLALRGGTVSTNRKYRGLPLAALGDLLKQDALFVSLDYEDVGDEVSYIRSLGRDVFWCPAILWHFDYLHTAALVAATDRVVTCCQSIAHLSAAMGHRVDVMVPSKPAWRYGLRSESWFWYPHSNARLLRQYGDDWTPASQKLSEAQETGLLSEVANG